jgi:Tfp pilus assembly protein PilV
MSARANASTGSTLIEVVVAMMITVSGALAMVQMVSIAVVTNGIARETSLGTVLAAQKVEELRTAPQLPSGGALTYDTPGYVDYLDAWGRPIGADRPRVAVFSRRWRIEPLPLDPDSAVVIDVLVTSSRSQGGTESGRARRHVSEVRVNTIAPRRR